MNEKFYRQEVAWNGGLSSHQGNLFSIKTVPKEDTLRLCMGEMRCNGFSVHFSGKTLSQKLHLNGFSGACVRL